MIEWIEDPELGQPVDVRVGGVARGKGAVPCARERRTEDAASRSASGTGGEAEAASVRGT